MRLDASVGRTVMALALVVWACITDAGSDREEKRCGLRGLGLRFVELGRGIRPEAQLIRRGIRPAARRSTDW